MIIDEFVVKYDVYVSNVLFTYKLLSSLAQLMHTHAHTCTHMHTHAHTCTHMHMCAHSDTKMDVAFKFADMEKAFDTTAERT